jgi:hypothetical protein
MTGPTTSLKEHKQMLQQEATPHLEVGFYPDITDGSKRAATF